MKKIKENNKMMTQNETNVERENYALDSNLYSRWDGLEKPHRLEDSLDIDVLDVQTAEEVHFIISLRADLHHIAESMFGSRYGSYSIPDCVGEVVYFDESFLNIHLHNLLVDIRKYVDIDSPRAEKSIKKKVEDCAWEAVQAHAHYKFRDNPSIPSDNKEFYSDVYAASQCHFLERTLANFFGKSVKELRKRYPHAELGENQYLRRKYDGKALRIN